MPSKSTRADTPTDEQVKCYGAWLKLKENEKYLQLSEELRQLKSEEQRAAAISSEAEKLYKEVFETEEKAKSSAREQFWKARDIYQRLSEAIEAKEQEICNSFGLFMWWDPDDPSITFDTVASIFDPTLPVQAVPVSPENRLGHNPFVDKDGWLTLKIHAERPFEELEVLIAQFLRLSRGPRRSRQHLHKDRLALEVYELYAEYLNFAEVAKKLGRRPSTIKGQYVKGFILVNGSRPTGSTKERRVSHIHKPEVMFQSHLPSCQRCQRAQTADDFCEKIKAYVVQDSVAMRESLIEREGITDDDPSGSK